MESKQAKEKILTLVKWGITKRRIEQAIKFREGYLSNVFTNNRTLNSISCDKINKYYDSIILDLILHSGNTILKGLFTE